MLEQLQGNDTYSKSVIQDFIVLCFQEGIDIPKLERTAFNEAALVALWKNDGHSDFDYQVIFDSLGIPFQAHITPEQAAAIRETVEREVMPTFRAALKFYRKSS